MRKVIHVRSFLNLLSELSLVNQHLKLGKAELRRKVQSCRYKIFLIIHPHMEILFQKTRRFRSSLFPSASYLSNIEQYQKGKVSWGWGWLRSLTFTQKVECTLFYSWRYSAVFSNQFKLLSFTVFFLEWIFPI